MAEVFVDTEFHMTVRSSLRQDQMTLDFRFCLVYICDAFAQPASDS